MCVCVLLPGRPPGFHNFAGESFEFCQNAEKNEMKCLTWMKAAWIPTGMVPGKERKIRRWGCPFKHRGTAGVRATWFSWADEAVHLNLSISRVLVDGFPINRSSRTAHLGDLLETSPSEEWLPSRPPRPPPARVLLSHIKNVRLSLS